MSFKNCPPGVSPLEIVGARPQTSNETSSFTEDAVAAAIVATSLKTPSSNIFFTNYAVDGVAAESHDVMRSICRFLDGKSKYLASVDNKHNAKSDRYQLIGGSCVAFIGEHIIDCDLLRQAGVTKDLWRVRDYASDKLTATLFSYKTLKNLAIGMKDEKCVGLIGDACALAASFCMMSLHLHSVNGTLLPAKHRALYLFTSMIFFTSTSGVSMTSKRNLVSETIGNLFLSLQKNIKKVHHCTSEPSEHTFGNMRMDNREFSIGDFCLLAEKEARRMKTMFDGDLSPSKTANKGYSATFLDWVADVKENQEEGGPCIIDTSNDDFTVIERSGHWHKRLFLNQ
jgi:hypothetical protein